MPKSLEFAQEVFSAIARIIKFPDGYIIELNN